MGHCTFAHLERARGESLGQNYHIAAYTHTHTHTPTYLTWLDAGVNQSVTIAADVITSAGSLETMH